MENQTSSTTANEAATVAEQGATNAPEQAPSTKKASKKAKGAAKKEAKPASKKASKKEPKATSKKAPEQAKPASKKASKAKAGAAIPREFSKTSIVLDLLQRKDGATMAEIAKATNWQNHSIRGFISGKVGKQMGLKVESTKNEAGERTYRIAAK